MVLEAFRKYNFTLNPAKCKFFQKTIEYLGREISVDGVRPGEHKINAVIKAPIPSNVKEVRQFLGFAEYFRKFVKDLAKKVSPLTNLLRKDIQGVWG